MLVETINTREIVESSGCRSAYGSVAALGVRLGRAGALELLEMRRQIQVESSCLVAGIVREGTDESVAINQRHQMLIGVKPRVWASNQRRTPIGGA